MYSMDALAFQFQFFHSNFQRTMLWRVCRCRPKNLLGITLSNEFRRVKAYQSYFGSDENVLF